MVCLLALLFLYQGGEPVSPDAVFEIKRFELKLEPEKQTLIKSAGKDEVVFRLHYEGPIDPAARIRASLIGPGLDASPYLVEAPATDMRIVIPSAVFAEEGIYRLTRTRLEMAGQVAAYAEPESAEIQVAENLLVTRVQVRELDQGELADLGYLFDKDDYHTVEFTLSLVMASQEIPVTVPVAFPRTAQKGFTPKVLRDPFNAPIQVAPMLSWKNVGGASPNLLTSGRTEQEPNYVMSLLVIPGEFNYLKTHFSVTCLALNAAPEGFDVRIGRLKARLRLPSPQAIGYPLTIDESPVQDMAFAGPDGELGTGDDRNAIDPGEEAKAQYIVTGEIEGMYDVAVDVTGVIELPQETLTLRSTAHSRVLVRHPDFTVTMEHPDAVAENEPYDLYMHFVNRGEVDLEGLSVALDPDRLAGVQLDGSDATQTVGSVAPGGEATVHYRLKSLITGQVVASYFKVEGDAPGALRLSVGVAPTGERISPYVIAFPTEFFAYLPTDLSASLKRYAKKLYDFAQLSETELPAGVSPVLPTPVRGLNQQLAQAVESRDYGISAKDADARLFSAWMRSFEDYAPIDLLRRKFEDETALNLESEFGALLQPHYGAGAGADALSHLAAQNEDAPGLFLMTVDAAAALDVALVDEKGAETDNAGRRELPFAAAIPLSPTRTLFWRHGDGSLPRVRLSPGDGSPAQATVSLIAPDAAGGRTLIADRALTVDGETWLDLMEGGARIVTPGGSAFEWDGAPLEDAAFELTTARQVDARINGFHDLYGRHILFGFSKPLDLASLEPLEEHVFINGEPVVDALLQSDRRLVIVSARMPLGPYVPIEYELRGARDMNGNALETLTGAVDPSSQFFGVRAAGRVVDHGGGDLAGARVFLWQKFTGYMFRSGTYLDDISQMVEKVVDPLLGPNQENKFIQESYFVLAETRLDAEARYRFDFIAFNPFATATSPDVAKRTLRQFKIGVELPDGRYEEREFFPKGVGGEIAADFAFGYKGEIYGQVIDETGQPIPFAPVFIINQSQQTSGDLVTADAQGYYRTENVQVGPVMVKSQAGQSVGLASGYLTVQNNPLRLDIRVAEPTAVVEGVVRAVVDGEEYPLSGVFVGALMDETFQAFANEFSFGLAANVGVRTGPDGSYRLEDVPARLGKLLFFHPHYGYDDYQVTLVEGEPPLIRDHYYHDIDAIGGSVSGTAVDELGNAVPNARVSTPWQSTVADAAGGFQLSGLPLNVSIAIAGREENGPRRGHLFVTLDESAPNLANQTLALEPPLEASGTYIDADGVPIAYAPVFYIINNASLFQEAREVGFTDAQGRWSGTIGADALGSAVTFTAVDPPSLAYVGRTIAPTGNTDILLQAAPRADISARLLDANGQPVVAKVFLESRVPNLGRQSFGLPKTSLAQGITSGDGRYLFRDVNLDGDIKIWGESLLLGQTEIFNQPLTPPAPGDPPLEIALAFSQTDLGALFGQVLDSDGVSPAPPGSYVHVAIDKTIHAQVPVDAVGYYRFDSLVETAAPRRVHVIAYNAENRRFAEDYLTLHQDLRFRHDMILGAKGDAVVAVEDSGGASPAFAAVEFGYKKLAFVEPEEPGDPPALGTVVTVSETIEAQITPEQQTAVFAEIPTGPVSVRAIAGAGLTGYRDYAMPRDGGLLELTVQLEAPSRIDGLFVDHGDQPIGEAEVQLRLIQGPNPGLQQQKLTGAAGPDLGRFSFADLPMRRYELYGVDPTSGLAGTARAATSPYTPEVDVVLKLDPVVELAGTVYHEGQPLADAVVELHGPGRFRLITGTDANGDYRFPNLAPARYNVRAHKLSITARAAAKADLQQAASPYPLDLRTERTVDLELTALLADLSPARKTLVRIQSDRYANAAFTDDQGMVRFENLPLDSYSVRAQEPQTLAFLSRTFSLVEADPDLARRELVFSGWGSIAGQVVNSLGQPLSKPVDVLFTYTTINGLAAEPGHEIVTRAVTTDPEGRFRLHRVATGARVRYQAWDPVTLESASGELELDEHGQEASLPIVFRAFTSVSGTVAYADGAPAGGVSVWTKDPVWRVVQTDAAGGFVMTPAPEGTLQLHVRESHTGRKAEIAVDVAADADGLLYPVDGVQIQLSGAAALRGYAVYADGDPLSSGRIELVDAQGDVHGEATILADGAFFMGQVPLGGFFLRAHDGRYGYDGALQPIELTEDGGDYIETYAFEDDHVLTGRLYAVNGADPVLDGWVELWRQLPNGRELRVYAAETNDQGFYSVDRVFPGLYRLAAGDESLTMTWSGTMIMPDQPLDLPLTLRPRAWAIGAVADANGLIFTEGTARLEQFGKVHRQKLGFDGTFDLRDLQPAEYTLTLSLAGGWIQHEQSGSLATGLNPFDIATVETATVSGRIIGTEADIRPVAFLYKDDVGRRLAPNGSGDFNLDYVPVGEDLTLRLSHGFVERVFPLGAFLADADIGAFFLDTSPPQIAFPNDGLTVASFDDIRFELLEPDGAADSAIATDRTRIWLNGEEISQFFNTTQTETGPDFPAWPEAALRGQNQLEIRVFNTHNAVATAHFTFLVDAAGSSVVVDLVENGLPVQGEVRLDQDLWTSTDAQGRAVLTGVVAEAVAIKGRSGALGKRVHRELGDRLAIHEILELASYAEYRGTVFGLDGLPVAGAEVRIGDQVERTDAAGAYLFDLLPLGAHHVFAESGDLLGYVQTDALGLPQSVLLNVNISLLGLGTVEGVVYDDDGVTPVPGVDVSLAHPGLPKPYDAPYAPVVADAAGFYRFDNVRMFPVNARAYHAATRRYGSGEGAVAAHGGTLTLDLQLAPTGSFVGAIVDESGQPIAGAEVSAERNGVSAVAVTGADGAFALNDLPQLADYRFLALDRQGNRFYKNSHALGQATRDLGSVALAPNQAPALANANYPDPYDPAQPFQLGLTASDDLGLKSVRAIFSGVYQGAEVYDPTGGLVISAAPVFRPDIPPAAPEGLMTVRVEIEDLLGSVYAQSFDIQVLRDAVGPAMTVSAPAAGETFTEGQLFHATIQADDPLGVDRVEIWRNDRLLAVDDPPQNRTAFEFDLYAPAVAAPADVFYELRGYDGSGYVSYGAFAIHVAPIDTFDPPMVQWLSPLPDMPQPIFLAQGLELPIAAAVEDAEGLARFAIGVNGALIHEAPLFGSAALIDETYIVPPVLRGESRLDITLTVVDLGGLEWSQTRTLHNLDGQVYDADLAINAWDSSYDGQSLILAGGQHVIDGAHDFNDLILVNRAVLTQTETAVDESQVAGTSLQVAGQAAIGYRSRIDMDGKGYHTLPQALLLGEGHASHGGLAKDAADPREAYGSPIEPVLPGSHRGGGALKLHAAVIWMAGAATADAFSDGDWNQGSGGSLWLVADRFEGFGRVSANGYKTVFSDWDVAGGGGRVAIYGDFAGTVEAFGADGGGAGTVFRRVPDGGEPDGFRDLLRIAHRGDAQAANVTPLQRLRDLEIGLDADYETLVIDNQSVDRLVFPAGTRLPLGAFHGMRVFREGEYSLMPALSVQSDALLQWPADPTPAAFADGELVQVDYAFDEVQVRDGARLHLLEKRPGWPLAMDDGGLVGGDAQIDLRGATLAMDGAVRLEGDFLTDPLIAGDGRVFHLFGQFAAPALDLRAGDSILDGKATADSVTIEAGARLQTPDGAHLAEIALEAPVMRIDGVVASHGNGRPFNPESRAFDYAHGGLPGGVDPDPAARAYGSLYLPRAQGQTNNAQFSGGRIHLRFTDSLTLNGVVDASGSPTVQGRGSGGSVLLEGGALAGSGALRANAGLNPLFDVFPGGGRIAALVDNADDFSGTFEAFGKQRATQSGGAGTVYLRTAALPHGRLLVDNGGRASEADSTPLPGLGARVATQATGGGSVIVGENFPDDLTGLYVVVDGYDPVRIAGNTETELYAEEGQSFPPLAAGAIFRGRHILDELIVRGAANLFSPDELDVRGVIDTMDGSVNAAILQNQTLIANQTLTIDDPSQFTSLSLDNAHVTATVPLQLTGLSLANGSTFAYQQPVTAGAVTVDGSVLQSAAAGPGASLTADSVTLVNGAVWTVADRPGANQPAFELRATVAGKTLVDATSVISTSGENKVSDAHVQWAGAVYETNGHGGYGRYDYAENGSIVGDWPVMGSFAYPRLQGSRLGGGAIEIHAGEIEIQGVIRADGHNSGSGGSIWLDAPLISGSGEVSARPGAASTIGGGGRIAIHYGADDSFRHSLTLATHAFAPSDRWNFKQGSGTLFLKGENQAYGELVVDQRLDLDAFADAAARRQRLTGIAGIATATLNLDDADPDPTVIHDPSWLDLPPGLGGLRARFQVLGVDYDIEVLANDYNRLILAESGPAIIPAGTQIQFALRLDKLTLRNGAQLFFAGVIEADALELAGAHLNSVYARDLAGLGSPFVLDGQWLRLILEAPDWQNVDVSLLNSQLHLDLPLQINNLALTHSWIAHSYAFASMLVVPDLDLAANAVTADAASGFDVSGMAQYDAPFGSGSHGGRAQSGQGVYGSPFFPRTFGGADSAGGGRLRVQAQTIHGGAYRADGVLGAGGSVLLEAATLSGDMDVSAKGGTNTANAGGRIAIYGDAAAANLTLSAETHSGFLNQAGPGTIYLEEPGQSHGVLVLDKGAAPGDVHVTPLPTFPPHALAADFTAVYDSVSGRTELRMPGLDIEWRDPGSGAAHVQNYAGYRALINGDAGQTYPILAAAMDGGDALFTLAGDVGTLAPGDTFGLAVAFDALQLCDDCDLDLTDLTLLDYQPPQVNDLAVAPAMADGRLWPGQSFDVSFTVADNARIQGVEARFDGVTQSAGNGSSFQFAFTAPTPSVQTDVDLVVTVMDYGGFRHEVALPLTVAETDAVPPTLAILSPADQSAVFEWEPFDVAIAAGDNRALDRVEASFGGQTQTFAYDASNQGQDAAFSFTAPDVVADQVFDLTAVAYDGAGLSASTQIQLTARADLDAPAVTISDPAGPLTVAPLEEFTVTFSAADNRILASAEGAFNGQIRTHAYDAANQSQPVSFVFTAPSPEQTQVFQVTIDVRDLAGNAGTAQRDITVQVDGSGLYPRPAHYWTFDNADRPDDLLDLVGGAHSSFDLFTAQPGQFAEAGYFSSASHKVEVDGGPALDFGAALTLSLWVKPNNFQANGGILVYGDGTQQPFGLKAASDNTIVFFGGTHDGVDRVITQPLTAGQWAHLAAVFDNGQAAIYVDGVLHDSATWSMASLPPAGSDRMLMLSDHHPDAAVSGRYFYGYLDELLIWGEALSAAQIQSLYGEMAGGTLPDFRPPEEVGALAVAPQADGLTFSWTAPANVAGDLAGLHLYFNGADQPLALPPDATNWQASGLAPLTSYPIRVTTVDAVQNESFGVTLLATALPASPAQIPKPVSYWSMDFPGVGGHDVGDVRGRNHAVYDSLYANQAGVAGVSTRFTSASHRAEIAGDPSLEPADELTLAAWFQPTSFSQDEGGLIVYGAEGREAYGLVIKTDDGQQVAFRAEDPAGATRLVRTPTRRSGTNRIVGQLETNQWRHLAAVFSRGQVSLYLDGEQVAGATWADLTALSYGPGSWLTFGTDYPGDDRNFYGYLDEALLFDRALSPEAVNLLHQTGRGGDTFHGAPLDFKPPEDPSNLIATNEADSLALAWTASPDSDGDLSHYHVYLDDQSSPAIVDGSLTQHALTGLTPLTLHRIRLTAVDLDGNESAGVSIHAATSPAAPAQPPFPTSYWSMDSVDTVGGVQDVMGVNHSAFHSAYLNQAGVAGEAIRVTSSSHRIEIPASPSLDTTNRLTLSAWIYATSASNGGAIMSYGGAAEEGFALTYHNDAGTYVAFRAGWPSDPHQLDAPATFAGNGVITAEIGVNQWRHLAAVFDQGQVAIYVDGVLRATDLWSLATLPLVNDRQLTFGRYTPDGAKTLYAYFDEFALWDEALSPEEINLYYWRTRRGERLAESGASEGGVAFLRAPQSYEDHDRIVLIDEDLRLEHFQTDKALWLIGSRLEVGARLAARAIVLRDGSRLVHHCGDDSQLDLIASQRIDIGRDSAIETLAAQRTDSLDEPLGDSPATPFKPGGVRLRAPLLQLDGALRAEGVAGGGSVLIQAHRIEGSGTIDVGGESGGHAAIHARNAFDFSGHVQAGERGTVYLLEAPPDQALLGDRWPFEKGLAMAVDVAEALILAPDRIQAVARDRFGTLLTVRADRDLRAVQGLWFSCGAARCPVEDVEALGDGLYRLRTPESLPDNVLAEPLRLMLPVANPEQLRLTPAGSVDGASEVRQ